MTFGIRRALTNKSNWKLQPNLVSRNILGLFKKQCLSGLFKRNNYRGRKEKLRMARNYPT